MTHKTMRRRMTFLALSAVVVGLGLTSRHPLAPGFIQAHAGDGLYAVLVYLLLTVVAPDAGQVRRGIVALGLCFAVEALQAVDATPGGALARIRALPFAHLVLGRGFVWVDLLRYGIGVGAAVATERVFAGVRVAAASGLRPGV